MAEYTRSKVFHPVFGYPGSIPENQLPTKLYLYIHYTGQQKNNFFKRHNMLERF